MRPTFAGTCFLIASLSYTTHATALTCGNTADIETCADKTCAVAVYKDSGGNWIVSPYNLIMTQNNTKIMFLMLQSGAQFVADPTKKNGLKATVNGQNQFSGQFPTDHFNSSPQQQKGPFWHVKFKNQGAGKDNIKYELTFEDGNGTITCDPLINNSGPLITKKRQKGKS
jgi:hypothetical protein